MKQFAEVTFNPAQCKREIDELGEFLQSKSAFAERAEIQPFFKKRQQLSAFVGTFVPDIGPATRLAYEFEVFGDFSADMVVGNQEQGAYCLIELEDAGLDSIFTTVKGKSTKEWGRRFEHGYSQLIDWFYSLADLKSTLKFAVCPMLWSRSYQV